MFFSYWHTGAESTKTTMSKLKNGFPDDLHDFYEHLKTTTNEKGPRQASSPARTHLPQSPAVVRGPTADTLPVHNSQSLGTSTPQTLTSRPTLAQPRSLQGFSWLLPSGLPSPPSLSSHSSTPPKTSPLHSRLPRLQPRGPAQACGASTSSAAPHASLGPAESFPTLSRPSGQGVWGGRHPTRSSLHGSPPPRAGERSRLSGSAGSRSPGRYPPGAGPPLPRERRGKRLPGTHLEPVVNISPGFPSTNSSAPALPSPPPTSLAAEGPPSLSSPSSLRPSALPPATHQRGRAAGGRGDGRGARERLAALPSNPKSPPSPVLAACSAPRLGAEAVAVDRILNMCYALQ
ncbi:uncharacterized protein LOC132649328 [Meriones unguiculatus]|uniref:uncharacterized protein LOC132649328 n=1 Tax=Meriones unguiculatus TaxID=10047 RepID=UPI00293E83A0|nr:uncharacterized protein LOC132649328 [Meriones unguiculatus]